MVKKSITIFTPFILVIFTTGFALDEKAIVDGAAQFLMERAKQNYIYIFEKQIMKDSLFLHYFPKTTQALSDLDLAMLLTNQKYIKENILTDIENIGYMAIKPSLDSAMSRIVKPLKVAADSIGKFDSTFTSPLKTDIKNIQNVVRDRVGVKYQTFDTVYNIVKTIVDIAHSNSIDTIINKYENMLVNPTLKSHVKGLGIAGFIGNREFFQQYATSLLDTISMICDTNKSFTSRIVASLDIIYKIELIRHNEMKVGLNQGFIKRFKRCKRYCLFFAQICDAQSPEVVKQILVSVSLPPVSYELQRQDGSFGVFINSYLGIDGGFETDFKHGQWYYGLSAPTGIEFVYGLSCGWSAGIFIPMIDLGKAITAQIYQKKTPQIAEIISPGLGVTFGVPSLPLAINLIYSYGMGIVEDSQGESHFAVSFAVEMPLLKLFSKDLSGNN